MDVDKYIQTLLDRFMAGTSSMEEEKELSEYFRTNEIKPEWKPFKEMFTYFDRGMENNPIRNKESNSAKITPMRKRWIFITAAVAVILMIIALTWRNSDVKHDRNICQSKKENTITVDNDTTNKKGLIMRNVFIAQNVATTRKVIRNNKAARKKHNHEKKDSLEFQKIDDEIKTCNDILQTAQKQDQEYMDGLEKDINISDKLIEIAYAVSDLNLSQSHQPKIQTVLVSPSASLDKAVASYTKSIIYK